MPMKRLDAEVRPGKIGTVVASAELGDLVTSACLPEVTGSPPRPAADPAPPFGLPREEARTKFSTTEQRR